MSLHAPDLGNIHVYHASSCTPPPPYDYAICASSTIPRLPFPFNAPQVLVLSYRSSPQVHRHLHAPPFPRGYRVASITIGMLLLCSAVAYMHARSSMPLSSFPESRLELTYLLSLFAVVIFVLGPIYWISVYGFVAARLHRTCGSMSCCQYWWHLYMVRDQCTGVCVLVLTPS